MKGSTQQRLHASNTRLTCLPMGGLVWMANACLDGVDVLLGCCTGDRACGQRQQGGHLHHVLQLWRCSEDAPHAQAERRREWHIQGADAAQHRLPQQHGQSSSSSHCHSLLNTMCWHKMHHNIKTCLWCNLFNQHWYHHALLCCQQDSKSCCGLSYTILAS